VAELGRSGPLIRIGVPPDFLGGNLPHQLVSIRKHWPDLHFSIHNGGLESQLDELRRGQRDLVIGLSAAEPIGETRHHWTEQMVWLRGRSKRLDPAAPVPLVSFGAQCIYHRTAVEALNRAGRDCELMLTAPTIASVVAAVSVGLGVTALLRSRVWSTDLVIWEDAPLPKLPQLFWGVYLREGGDRTALEHLADSIALELRTRTEDAARPPSGRNPKSTVVFARRAASA
jgi:DNA-binding transcriptional LysR family regulator